MDERTKQVLVGIIVAVIFIASVALIIIGQKNIGPQGLLTMLAGLAGLIGLLAFYNRKRKAEKENRKEQRGYNSWKIQKDL